jgi:DNA polymerase III epsilon subunit-like protein
MSYFMVDVESDGEIPGTDDFSMTEVGVVLVREPLVEAPRFHGMLKPISPRYNPEALKVSGRTREETLTFPDPLATMLDLEEFVRANNVGKRAMFISDNNGFDFMFVAWYFHHFLGRNPFGHSSTNLGSLYKGTVGSMFKNFKHLRKTKHTHNPVEDAVGNAEALIEIVNKIGLKIILE